MARTMAKICLFTFLLLSQLLTANLLPRQLAASVSTQTDVERDLEEIESLHDAELQFASQFETEHFCQTDCQFYDRAQLMGKLSDSAVEPDEVANFLRTIELELLKPDGLKPDVPPTPRAVAQTPLLSTEPAAEPLVLESTLCEIESELCDVSRYHGESLSRRPVWKAASGFLAAQRTSLNEAVRFTTRNVEGFCYWADERIESAQIANDELANDELASNEPSGNELAGDEPELANNEPQLEELVEEASDEELLASIAAVEIPMFLVPIIEEPVSLEPVSLEPIASKKIPMFNVAIIEGELETERVLIAQPKEPVVALEPVATIAVPMFLVTDVENVEQKSDSEVAKVDPPASEGQLAEVSIEPAADVDELPVETTEPANSLLPEDVFINEIKSRDSIQLERSDRDPYWQYYDDCDRWGVDFAKLIFEAQLIQPHATGSASAQQSTAKAVGSNRAGATAASASISPFLIHHALTANSQASWVLSLPVETEAVSKPLQRMWQEMLDQSEFCIIEEQRHQAILFRVQPLSPFAAVTLIRQPLWDHLSQMGVESTDFTWMFDSELFSCRVCEFQFEYADQIRELTARSEAMKQEQRNRSLSLIANQCRQLADSLNRFADSITSEVTVVADKGKSTATK